MPSEFKKETRPWDRTDLTFDWEVLDVLISGQSAIDTEKSLGLKNLSQAKGFLNCYGYDEENPIEKAELFGHFHEATNFIRKYFLHPSNAEGIKAEIPRKILELGDPVQLLVLASQGQQGAGATKSMLHLWACAILKVMHTISHMDKDLRTQYFPDIQKQILDRIYKHIHNEDGRLFLSKNFKSGFKVPLVAFETKPKKSRDSVLLKLLHKPEAVAEDIFDRVGIRFVTETKLDALRVVKYLKENYVVMPANIKPSRSRNTLINTKKIHDYYLSDEWVLHRNDYEASMKNLSTLLDEPLEPTSVENPHTSRSYKSIQFTCRQLIKIKNPLYEDLLDLKQKMKAANVDRSLFDAVERLDLQTMSRESRFFYPYEIQIIDEKNHQESLQGASAHSTYKNNQVMAAMKRVMKGFL